MVRLFQVELEHYEKIEGATLSLEGKANRLALMIRGNLGMAMQGLAVVPLFAGYDLDADRAARPGGSSRYDVTGGRYEEHKFHSVGSGSLFARGALKKLCRDDFSRRRRDAVRGPGALRRGRRRLRHRRPGPDPAHLPGRVRRHRRRLPATPDDEVGAIVDAVVAGPDGQPGRPAGAAAMTRRPDDSDRRRRLRGAPS